MFENGDSFIHKIEKAKTKLEMAKHEEELEKKKGQPKETPITHHEPSKHIEKKAKDSIAKKKADEMFPKYMRSK